MVQPPFSLGRIVSKMCIRPSDWCESYVRYGVTEEALVGTVRFGGWIYPWGTGFWQVATMR